MTSGPRFFGYGSLVNLATHDYPDARPATLTGWRRVWRSTQLRPYAFLSVEPAEEEILGVSVALPGGDWAALDAREAAYSRRDVTRQTDIAGQTAVYEVTAPLAPGSHPALLSYLDTVVQGYALLGGAAAVGAFFASTHRWEGGVLNDRAAPVYPRAQRLTKDQTALVDAMLDEREIPVIGA